VDVTDLADALVARLDQRQARVVVMGQGHVGLPVAMRSSAVGFTVVGFDTDAERVAALGAGTSYITDVADAELAGALEQGYRATDDPADLEAFDVAVITVPTPLREGMPDLSHVEQAAGLVADALRPGALVVLESTTYPGTTNELVRPILERTGLLVGRDFFLGYSPERIDPGNPSWGLVNTPKVVSGVDEPSLRCVEVFYEALVDKVVPVGTPAEAELVKLLENTFRHVNIALVNELAMYASELGIDIWSAIDAASTKPFGYLRFTPGPGVGGHCLPIDPSFLSWRVKRSLGRTFRFVELANDINEHMPDYVVTRIMTLLNRDGLAARNSRILVLGLSYKAGTSDWRESPSLAVVERLIALGADVRAWEPHLPPVGLPQLPVPVVPCTVDEIAAADLVVVLVEHPELPLDDIAEHARLVLDTRGCLRDRTFHGELL
jgi:UDP-N-acetyl-D-mannosaminuronic acid dehydrogenase/UDP-N-acetyl-D-glucosamine dehydrogenase